VKGRDIVGDLGIDGRIILNMIVKKYNGRMRRFWTGVDCGKHDKKLHVLRGMATFPAILAIISFSGGS
jgi:hypothetical protein